jgi:hypothetical protein
VTVAMPVLHFLGLIAQMGPEYHVLPEQTVGRHVVSGFASREGKTIRVLLYAHSALDTQSRSDAPFDISLHLTGLPGGKLAVREYRFDKDHNSYFRLGRELRDRPVAGPGDLDRLQDALRELESDKPATQIAGLEKLAAMGSSAASAAGAIFQLHQRATDEKVKQQATETLKKVMVAKSYPAAEVKKIEELSKLRSTASSVCEPTADGTATVKVRLAGNGANFLVLEPPPSR